MPVLSLDSAKKTYPRRDRFFRPYWSLLILALLLPLLIGLAWQLPATFYLDADAGNLARPKPPQTTAEAITSLDGKSESLLYNFYEPETSNDGLRFRWATTNSGLQLPPLYAGTKITLRLFALLRPDTPLGQLAINLDEGQETGLAPAKTLARFDLQPGWHEYSFVLDKKLAGPGYVDLILDAPAFQVKGDWRLLTVGFNWVRVEAADGLKLPPLSSLLVLWLVGLSLALAAFFQSSRLNSLPLLRRIKPIYALTFFYLLTGLSLFVVAGFQRIRLAHYWLLLLLLAFGLAAISGLLRPSKPDTASAEVKIERSDHFWEWLFVILVLAAFLRLYNLEVAPLGILPDEAVLGYDDYSIVNTAHDHHGDFLPFYFRNFNDYTPGVANYVALPFVGIFGLSLWSIRLPFALLGIGVTFFAALLALEFFRPLGRRASRTIALLAAFFVALSPWAISQSRLAMPASSISFFFLGGFWLFLRARRLTEEATNSGHKLRAGLTLTWIAAGLLLALAVWTYPTMKLVMAVFVAGLLLIYRPFFWRHRRAFFAWAIPFGAVCLPFTLWALFNWPETNNRFTKISVWAGDGGPKSFLDGLGRFLTNYLQHYDPLRLFLKLTGDYTVTMSSRPALIGVVLPALLIPAILGLLLTFTRPWRSQPAIWLLWLWLLVFPLGDSFVRDEVPDEMRAITGVALFEILAAFGCWWLWNRLVSTARQKPFAKNRRFYLGYLLAALFALSFVLSSGAYLHYNFVSGVTYPLRFFRSGYGEALAEAEKLLPASGTGKICIEYTSQSYILALFYTRYDPATYQAFARQNDPPRLADPYLVTKFGPYQFGCEAPQGLRSNSGDIAIARFPKAGTQTLWQNFYPNGDRDWSLVR